METQTPPLEEQITPPDTARHSLRYSVPEDVSKFSHNDWRKAMSEMTQLLNEMNRKLDYIIEKDRDCFYNIKNSRDPFLR